MKWREAQLKQVLRKLFESRGQAAFRLEELESMMSAVPRSALTAILSEIVGNQSFRIRVGSQQG